MKIFWLFLGSIIIVFILIIVTNTLRNQSSSLPITQPSTSSSNTSSSGTTLSAGEIPSIPFKLPSGYVIHTFSQGLGNPRDLTFSPEGTLLVSVPGENTVIALPDTNHDGVADSHKEVLKGSTHVHGIGFYNGKLFVAEVNKVVRYTWNEKTLKATLDKTLFSLPNNSNHNNRTLTFDEKGNMYISVGSTCNVCNENSKLSATVLISNENGITPQIFASGLRNAPFIQFNPLTHELWGTEMGRDNLGDNLPPDEIDIIKQGNNYGWPNCFGNKIHDTDFNKSKKDPCTSTIPPIFEIPAHSAPLGLAFITSSQFPSEWQNDLFVSYHGSWNRSTPIGYKVVHMKVSGNTITSSEDFLTGFLQKDDALGRPVDLVFDKEGNLYLSDDKAGAVYIIQKS